MSYALLAELLEYPTPDLVSSAERLGTLLRPRCPGASEALLRFAELIAGEDLDALEELYVSTFDIGASCCLETGYQLFGETYKRGVFLVQMREALRAHGIAEGSELPDFLPSVLRLLGRLEPSEDPRGLCEEVLLPAVQKMRAGLSGKDSPYDALLDATQQLLHADFRIPVRPILRSLPIAPKELER